MSACLCRSLRRTITVETAARCLMRRFRRDPGRWYWPVCLAEAELCNKTANVVMYQRSRTTISWRMNVLSRADAQLPDDGHLPHVCPRMFGFISQRTHRRGPDARQDPPRGTPDALGTPSPPRHQVIEPVISAESPRSDMESPICPGKELELLQPNSSDFGPIARSSPGARVHRPCRGSA